MCVFSVLRLALLLLLRTRRVSGYWVSTLWAEWRELSSQAVDTERPGVRQGGVRRQALHPWSHRGHQSGQHFVNISNAHEDWFVSRSLLSKLIDMQTLKKDGIWRHVKPLHLMPRHNGPWWPDRDNGDNGTKQSQEPVSWAFVRHGEDNVFHHILIIKAGKWSDSFSGLSII